MGPMPAKPDLRTERGFDRFVNFSDAVVAIAISLLILPVVDAVNESLGPDASAWDFLKDNSDRLLAFGLSFVLIASFWVIHHGLFEEVKTYSKALMWWNLAWLATIVFLPLPTEILAVHSSDEPFVRFLYIASVLLVSVTLTGLEISIDRDPDVRIDPDAPRPRWISRLASRSRSRSPWSWARRSRPSGCGRCSSPSSPARWRGGSTGRADPRAAA